MDLPNLFEKENVQSIIDRIENLNTEQQAEWGKMSVDQMLAHCNVTYDMIYSNNYESPNFIAKLMFKAFIKPIVVGTKAYKKNSRTAPQFIIADKKVFEEEKAKLIQHLHKTAELGESHFEGKASISFGKLSANEWNNMFYKHLDHHLKQFGQ